MSICIPAYNAENHIAETLNSVLNSTYTNLEVIVHDDGSTDNTLGVLEEVTDPRVRIFSSANNQGVPQNWNRALEKATGNLVGLLNHDDRLGPFWIEYAVRTLQKYPHIGWITSAFQVVDVSGKTINVISHFDQTGPLDQEQLFFYLIKMNGLSPTYIARRELIEEIGGYDDSGGPGADNEFYLRMAVRYPAFYSDNPLHVSWLSHETNLTYRWTDLEQLHEYLWALDKLFADENLPAAWRQYQFYAYDFFYRKWIKRLGNLIETGQIDRAQQICAYLNQRGMPEDW